jgi:uncharacterized paraquat-inducible protein A
VVVETPVEVSDTVVDVPPPELVVVVVVVVPLVLVVVVLALEGADAFGFAATPVVVLRHVLTPFTVPSVYPAAHVADGTDVVEGDAVQPPDDGCPVLMNEPT